MGVRIKDIARLAEVSPATVSLVLNNKPGVGEDTRAKIRKIARELQYFRPKAGKQPAGSDGTICFLHITRHGHTVNRDHDVFIADYMEGLGQGAKQFGMNLEVMTFSTMPIENIIEAAREHADAGVIVLGTELSASDLEAFSGLDKPLVFIDTYHEFMGFDFVDMNNEESIYTLVSHLQKKGHESIGIVKSSVETRNFKLREEGFRESLLQLGLPFRKQFMFPVDSTFHGAYRDMKGILDRGTELPTALVCGNDIIACGCLKALKENGIRVPDDISLAGFDDLPLAAVSDPPLTTIQVSKSQIGQMAVQLLATRIQAKNHQPPVKVLISGRLVERESVKDLTVRSPLLDSASTRSLSG